jgi:predicted Zn-dependent protease
MSESTSADYIAKLLSAGLTKSDPAVQQQVMTVYGLGAQYGVLLPFSRSQESEADHIGLILMAKAGYDPHKAVEFWKRMQAEGAKGGKPPEFLSTHPSDERRIAQIEAWLPEAMKYYHQPN